MLFALALADISWLKLRRSASYSRFNAMSSCKEACGDLLLCEDILLISSGYTSTVIIKLHYVPLSGVARGVGHSEWSVFSVEYKTEY